MATRLRGPNVRVFTLDTGRLHAATLEFVEKVRPHYNLEIEELYPVACAVEKLVREKGFLASSQTVGIPWNT